MTLMPPLDLTDDEHSALVRLVRSAIDEARYPLSPRVKMLRAILEKLDPAARQEPRPELPPPLPAGMTSRRPAAARRRRWR
jgi:hypothetical protein